MLTRFCDISCSASSLVARSNMKLIILFVAVAWSNAAKLDRAYLPPSHAQTSGGSGSFLQTPNSKVNGQDRNVFGKSNNFGNDNDLSHNDNGFSRNHNNGFAQNDDYNNAYVNSGFESGPERAQAAFERNAAILRQDNSNDGETYTYAYETENGIYGEENGIATNGVEARGSFSYTGDDGQVYSIRYTADQNGFVPQGDHLPTPPPVPEEILRALEQNARDEAAGIFDDGSYNEGKYNNGDEYATNNGYEKENTYNSNAYNGNDDDTVVTNSAAAYRGADSGFRQANDPENKEGRQGNKLRSQSYGRTSDFFQQNGGNKAYLPPFARQQGRPQNARNFGSRRQPSFDKNDGYQY